MPKMEWLDEYTQSLISDYFDSGAAREDRKAIEMISGFDVYRAYQGALFASEKPDELIARVYIPSNWEDEPESIKAIFEEMAVALNASQSRVCDKCGESTGSLSTICDDCFDKQQ